MKFAHANLWSMGDVDGMMEAAYRRAQPVVKKLTADYQRERDVGPESIE